MADRLTGRSSTQTSHNEHLQIGIRFFLFPVNWLIISKSNDKFRRKSLFEMGLNGSSCELAL